MEHYRTLTELANPRLESPRSVSPVVFCFLLSEFPPSSVARTSRCHFGVVLGGNQAAAEGVFGDAAGVHEVE